MEQLIHHSYNCHCLAVWVQLLRGLTLSIRSLIVSWSFSPTITAWTHYILNFFAAISTVFEFQTIFVLWSCCCHHSSSPLMLWYISVCMFTYRRKSYHIYRHPPTNQNATTETNDLNATLLFLILASDDVLLSPTWMNKALSSCCLIYSEMEPLSTSYLIYNKVDKNHLVLSQEWIVSKQSRTGLFTR